jgi:hypothetical protein
MSECENNNCKLQKKAFFIASDTLTTLLVFAEDKKDVDMRDMIYLAMREVTDILKNYEQHHHEDYIKYYKEYKKNLWAAEKKYINCLVGFSVLTLLLLVMIGFLSLK